MEPIQKTNSWTVTDTPVGSRHLISVDDGVSFLSVTVREFSPSGRYLCLLFDADHRGRGVRWYDLKQPESCNLLFRYEVLSVPAN